MAEKKVKKFSWGKTALCCLLALVIGFAGGFVGWFFLNRPTGGGDAIPAAGELSVHIMTLGNDKAGDSIYIKAGETDILVDGGSATDSVPVVREYLDQYVTDGIFEYVIVTHADLDHIAGFAGTTKENTSLFDFYKCGTIIDFARTNKDTQAYVRYVEKRDREVAEDGAKHYTALECWDEQGGASREYALADGITLEILYNYYYENASSDENNYSVCFLIRHGERNFLFTGDLEKEGEEYLVENNDLPEVEFYKAGHHGSKTSSTIGLLEKIKPKICVASCVAGSVEYTQNLENTFPTQQFIDNIARFTDRVYVPAYTSIKKGTNSKGEEVWINDTYGYLNGNIVVISGKSGVSVSGSENDVKLKDTEWFKNSRVLPEAWKAA